MQKKVVIIMRNVEHPSIDFTSGSNYHQLQDCWKQMCKLRCFFLRKNHGRLKLVRISKTIKMYNINKTKFFPSNLLTYNIIFS